MTSPYGLKRFNCEDLGKIFLSYKLEELPQPTICQGAPVIHLIRPTKKIEELKTACGIPYDDCVITTAKEYVTCPECKKEMKR